MFAAASDLAGVKRGCSPDRRVSGAGEGGDGKVPDREHMLGWAERGRRVGAGGEWDLVLSLAERPGHPQH